MEEQQELSPTREKAGGVNLEEAGPALPAVLPGKGQQELSPPREKAGELNLEAVEPSLQTGRRVQPSRRTKTTTDYRE